MLDLIRGASPPPGFEQKPLQPDSESTHEAGHSLHDVDEEADLFLSEVLQESVRSGCALNFGEDLNPAGDSVSSTQRDVLGIGLLTMLVPP